MSLARKDDRRAVVYAVLVHLVLVAVVVVSVRWQAKPHIPVRPILARAVTDAETRQEVERRKRDERAREEAQERARKQKELDERRAADARRKADAEKRKLVERQKKEKIERQKAAEQSMKEQLAREEKERTDQRKRNEQAEQERSELARYEALIRQRVERSWVRPAGWTRDMECIVRVRLVPTGEVVSATVIRSSGSVAFDRSVENAVYKAAPLPLPDEPGLFEHFRELELRFKPEGRQ